MTVVRHRASILVPGAVLADPDRSVVSRFERLLRRLMVERSRLANPVVR